MTNWKVNFQRSNGTQGSDIFTANTQQEARHDFKECYRHGTGNIISVEEVKTIETKTERKTYRAEFEDNEIEVYTADSDLQAITEAYEMEKEHKTLWNIFLLDENYNEVKSIF